MATGEGQGQEEACVTDTWRVYSHTEMGAGSDHSPNSLTTTFCPLILVRPSTSIISDAIVFGTSTHLGRCS